MGLAENYFDNKKIKVDFDESAINWTGSVNEFYRSLTTLKFHSENETYNFAELLKPYREQYKENSMYEDLVPSRFLELNGLPLEDNEVKFYQLIEALRRTSSTKDRISLVRQYYDMGSDTFKQQIITIFDLIHSPLYVYDLKEATLEKTMSNDVPQAQSLSEVLYSIGIVGRNKLLNTTVKRKHFIGLLNKFEDNYAMYQIIKCIILKDFKIGLKEKNLNEAIPITIIPYMRCEKENFLDKRITFGTEEEPLKEKIIVQEKCDGKFSNILVDSLTADVIMINRSGKKQNLTTIQSKIKEFLISSKWAINYYHQLNENVRDSLASKLVFHGEALLKIPNTKIDITNPLEVSVVNRKKGNALFNSLADKESVVMGIESDLISAKATKVARKRVLTKLLTHFVSYERINKHAIFQLWYVLPYEHWKARSTHTHTLKFGENICKNFIGHLNNHNMKYYIDPYALMVQSIEVNTKEELYAYYEKMLELNKEGVVVKNPNVKFKDGDCKEGMIKLKDFSARCDLKIIGYYPGTNKYTGGIGSYIGESSCGKIRTRVGGLKRHQKGFEPVDPEDSSKGVQLISGWENEARIGDIMTVVPNEISIGENSDVYKFTHCTVLEFRDDKTEADSLEEILAENKTLKLPKN